MANRYSKALKHLKNKNIDEKLELLEQLPTNNTAGLYVDVPGTFEPEEIGPGDLPPNDGLNLGEDGQGQEGYTGNDTTGLFLADGTIKSVEPPGDTSYILGPMMSMWYAWANYTQIGYVRQSDRKMVNLGRITGEMSAWDGETGFTGYGQLSLEQAVWFKGQTRADYRAFYPGPPSNPADEYGRYIGSLISSSKSTQTIVPSVDIPGTNKTFDPTDDLSLLMKDRESDKDRSDEIARMVLNAAMLGLDIVAVLALIFPEPGSSIAGAAHLATKLRYVAKLRRFRGALNPFGQRAVRSGAAGRVRRQVFSGRPYQGKRGFGKTTYGTTNRATARTYSNPGPLKGTPGTGSRVNPRGTVDSGTLPQRYIDKYGSRSVLGQKQVKLGPKAAKRTFGEENKFILEQINYLLETAATGSGLGGGTEIADGYVDKVSETSSPEQLEKASDDANNIATAGGKGLSDANLLKIDKDAEEEAKRVTNIRISNPDSLSGDQLFDSLDLMYESDPEITMQLLDQYEYLIDTVKLDKEYEKYTERKEYISSQEFARNFSPEYARQYDIAQNLWDNYFNRGLESREATFTRDNVPYWWSGRTPEEGQTFYVSSLVFRDTGIELSSSEYQKLRQWSAAYKSRDDLYLNKVYPEKKRQRELAESEYRIVSNAIFRPSLLAMIRGWNEMFGGNDDPFSIKDYVNQQGDLQNMSEAEKKKLLKFLEKSGLSYGEIAAVPLVAVPLLANPAVQAAILGAGAGLTYELQKRGAGQAVVDSVVGIFGGLFGNKGQKETNKLPPRYGGYNPDGTPRIPMKGEPGYKPKPKPKPKGTGDGTDGRPSSSYNPDKPGGGPQRKRFPMGDSYDPPKFLKNRERNNLIETRTPKQKRILRDIKKPVEVKEMPTKFKVKPTGRKNKSVGVDMMNIPDVPKQYKPPMNMWGKHEYKQNVRRSQEKKNEVLELLGAAEHHWTYLTDDRRKQKQEKVNEMMSAEFDKQMELLYEKHRIKESKVNKAISAFKKPTDIKPEYPENPPPQMDPETGMHPKYGKRYKHDKLDPHSAEFMPPTGDPVIDANIKKATNAKEKSRKLKVLLGKGKKISESMTTSDLFSTTLPATGDVDLEGINNNASTLGTTPGFSQNGNNYNFGPSGTPGEDPRGSSISMNSIDSTKYDTISFDFSGGTIDTFYMVTGSPANSTYNLSTGSGRKTITLKSGDRKSRLFFALHVERGGTDNLPVGTNRVTNLSFQRRTPMNVFVSLDSPEATAFIRTDPSMQGLSAEERRKKLIKMLDAGDEYLLKYLGLIGSKARPSDVTMPDSWEQASGNPDTGGQPGYHSPGSTSPSGAAASDKNMTWDNHMKMYVPNIGIQDMLKKASGGKDYGNVAQAGMKAPHSNIKYDKQMKQYVPDNTNADQILLDKLKKAKKNEKQKTMVAHHEPEGDVLSEKKKSFKDLTKKVRAIKKLKESMTTASLVSATLPPQDLANYTTDQIVSQDALSHDSLIPPDATVTISSDGHRTWTMNNSPDPGSAGVVAGFNVDLSRMDTISVSVYFTNATIDTDGAHFVIDGPPGSGLQQFVDLSVPGSGSGNANPTITIPPELRIKGAHVAFVFVGQTIDGTRQVGTNAVKITSCFPYRRAPMNVFVSLDSPEATAFIRTDPSMQGLSAEDRRKKLIAMLDAGDEYLLKYLGLIGSKARPSDVSMPDSWEQAAGKDYENIAQAGMKAPHSNIKYDKHMKQYVPDNTNADQILLDKLKKAKNQNTSNYVVAHYKPKGETIMEKNKKSFKDLTKKIPGYYDGKPAPLGFPMEEPPKMKNGFHPDLVDGKKVSDRFNRLDPISAKAMPPTGNPHIDKKVRAAAKKPK